MQQTVHGQWDKRFDGVADALADEIAKGDELGASIAVDLDGELVVDIWGGHADRAATIPWAEHTIVNFWSCSKTLTALAALILVDRGQLDPFAPVAAYWPEFGANGKQDIEIRHLLAHTSGVSGWEAPFGIDDIYDWTAATERLAKQEPWWAPGTASGYHALNYGHLIGEVVRRITGSSLKDFIRDEIATPLQADVQLGARPEDTHRIAELVPPPPLDLPLDLLPADHPLIKTFGPLLGTTADFAAVAETDGWRRADIGGANGHGNARALARALSPISRGGAAHGVQLLRPETIDLIFSEQVDGTDVVLMVPLRFGIGFGLPSAAFPAFPEGRICFWGGWGGSMAVMDTDRRATITYVMNKMGPGTTGTERTNRYATAIYEALG
ncbi:CubicO group peptidase, beta-lactamase class C family [Mycolicibacterium rutilum]|uniref:CubicO group peptidase, beta-lactamase class C family n=1 Tax=Mycolicibacterium rutilum TaxID=370526 RepID=A0A1H6JEM5_MYCRU|nr:serine hydrolase domain-containing protein [Mycolicibacterium rutilum]SEH60681.1 CubicO group peptidase, beta-lactamase class C family [Mycolicibacterium rutilum]